MIVGQKFEFALATNPLTIDIDVYFFGSGREELIDFLFWLVVLPFCEKQSLPVRMEFRAYFKRDDFTWKNVICKLLAKFGFREARENLKKKKFILIERIELYVASYSVEIRLESWKINLIFPRNE